MSNSNFRSDLARSYTDLKLKVLSHCTLHRLAAIHPLQRTTDDDGRQPCKNRAVARQYYLSKIGERTGKISNATC